MITLLSISNYSHDPVSLCRYYDYSYQQTPEQKLAAAVFFSAICDLNDSDSQVRGAARVWLRSPDSVDVTMSAKWCLAMAGLDPDIILPMVLAHLRRTKTKHSRSLLPNFRK